MIEGVSRFVGMVRQIPPAQLRARLRLRIKRSVASRLATRAFKERCSLSEAVPQVAASLPRSPFPRAADRISLIGGDPSVDLVGTQWTIHPPVQWHGGRLEVGTRLEKLHLHYQDYLESADDDLFAAIIDDWIDRNPPYTGDYWRHNWNSYALSIRVVAWMKELVERRERFADERVERWLRSLSAQIRFLRNNIEEDIRGNHIIRNIRALLWASAFFSGKEAERARALGIKLLRKELEAQILPDGFHFERSPAYHAQVLTDLIDCRAVLPSEEVRDSLDRVLEQMALALAKMTHPDGTPALFNDGGLHMARSAAELIAAAGQFVTIPPVEDGSFTLPAAGYHGVRIGDEYFVADCGVLCPDLLPAHAHGDVLSFEWSVGLRRIVVDQGVFEYHPGDRRRRSRTAASHNTVAVEGGDQAEFWSSFRVGRRPTVRVEQWDAQQRKILLSGSHDGFSNLEGEPVHRRSFEVHAGEVTVRDSVDGGAGQDVTSGILLHPEVAARYDNGSVRLFAGAEEILMSSSCPIEIHEAVWWPDLGVEIATKRLVVRYGPAPCKGLFTLTRSGPRPTKPRS
jgi:uncharacterized heparinase superfamily protein